MCLKFHAGTVKQINDVNGLFDSHKIEHNKIILIYLDRRAKSIAGQQHYTERLCSKEMHINRNHLPYPCLLTTITTPYYLLLLLLTMWSALLAIGTLTFN